MSDLPKGKFMAVLGKPVMHSKSPLMHNTAFKDLGLDYEYIACEADENTLEEVVNELRDAGICGFNCTMPVKTKMYTLCDELSNSAKIMKAVNTVVVKDGKFFGYNTDGAGFVNAIAVEGFFVEGNTFTIMGTGGAASAICTQIALDGAKKINIFGRDGKSYDSFLELVDRLKEKTDCDIVIDTYDDIKLYNCISKSDILVNCSSVGMKDIDACIINDFSSLKKGMLVYDVIYEPAQTKLLKMARESGCVAMNGINMLYYQGAEAFNIWTGKKMPERIRELIL